ncbi:MAG: NADPH:quinone oxidoreductase family protein [Rhodospirillaceae bacterium]
MVDADGDDVTTLAPGDRVMALVEYGAFAEKMAVAAALCHPMPDGLSFVKAAAMGVVYMTAYCALVDRANLRAGESVLVLGAKGGVGVASVQVAKALGAGTVIAGLRDMGAARALRAAGADYVVDLAAADLRDSLRVAVYAVTDGHGVDVVIDPVGGDACAAALRALAWRGRLVVVGFASGSIPEFKANYLLVKNIAVTGLQMSDYRDRLHEETAAAQAELFRFYEAGTLDPVVSDVLPLAGFAEALERIRAGGVLGKVVLEIG